MPTQQAPPVQIPVAWGDMDAFGHVNNTVYLRWFETARIAFFASVNIPQRDVSQTHAPILAHTSCSFELPLTYPDTVEVGCSIERIGTKSFTMHYTVYSRQHGRLAAHGDAVVVWFDYASKASAPLPDDLRARLEQHRKA